MYYQFFHKMYGVNWLEPRVLFSPTELRWDATGVAAMATSVRRCLDQCFDVMSHWPLATYRTVCTCTQWVVYAVGVLVADVYSGGWRSGQYMYHVSPSTGHWPPAEQEFRQFSVTHPAGAHLVALVVWSVPAPSRTPPPLSPLPGSRSCFHMRLGTAGVLFVIV